MGRDLLAGLGEVWWQAMVLGALFIGSSAALWRGRVAGFCGPFFFIVLAPSSSVVAVVTQTIAEHRIYLALAGIASLAVVSFHAWVGRSSLVVVGVIAPVLAEIPRINYFTEDIEIGRSGGRNTANRNDDGEIDFKAFSISL